MSGKSNSKDIEIISMCDIDNPMYGSNGAAHVLHRRRERSMILHLDKGIEHLSEVIKKDLDKVWHKYPGLELLVLWGQE